MGSVYFNTGGYEGLNRRVSGEKPLLLAVYAILTFTVLYYFLRFQWGWNQYIIGAYFLSTFVFSIYGIGIVIKKVYIIRGLLVWQVKFYLFMCLYCLCIPF